MSSVLKYKNLVIFILLSIVLLIGYTVYTSSFKEIVVVYRNIDNVKLSEIKGDGKRVVVNNKVKNSQKIKVKKDKNYEISYSAKYPYSSGVYVLNNSANKIIIYPYYSQKKVDEMLSVEEPVIRSVLNTQYDNISYYKIQKGKLYYYGKWYATTLQYIGNDPMYSDTLRVVLEKSNGKWEVKSNPPSITLSKFTYSDIPESILRDINNTYIPMDTKFIDKSSVNYSPY